MVKEIQKLGKEAINAVEELLNKGAELDGGVGAFFTDITPHVIGVVILYILLRILFKVFNIKKIDEFLNSNLDAEKDSNFSQLFPTNVLIAGNLFTLAFMLLCSFIFVIMIFAFVAAPFYEYRQELEVNYFAHFVLFFSLAGATTYLLKNMINYIEHVSKRLLVLKKRKGLATASS